MNNKRIHPLHTTVMLIALWCAASYFVIDSFYFPPPPSNELIGSFMRLINGLSRVVSAICALICVLIGQMIVQEDHTKYLFRSMDQVLSASSSKITNAQLQQLKEDVARLTHEHDRTVNAVMLLLVIGIGIISLLVALK